MPPIADEFFKTDIQSDNFHFDFSIASKEQFTKALREFADKVEAGGIAMQEARAITRAKGDDFVICSLILRYVERRI